MLVYEKRQKIQTFLYSVNHKASKYTLARRYKALNFVALLLIFLVTSAILALKAIKEELQCDKTVWFLLSIFGALRFTVYLQAF